MRLPALVLEVGWEYSPIFTECPASAVIAPIRVGRVSPLRVATGSGAN